MKLIQEIKADYNINDKRVYVTGMSNGAMMSYRLSCEPSSEIAAIATVASGMVYENCKPSEPVGVIHFHSYRDSNIPFFGGVGGGLSDHENIPIDTVRNMWARYNECEIFTTIAQVNEGANLFSNLQCKDSTEVFYYVTLDGGHTWPGGRAPTRKGDAPKPLMQMK